MKITARFFALCIMSFALFTQSADAAACHVPNLIRCIDSACVAGLSGDPTVRCGLCGSSAVTLTRRPSTTQRASATTLEIRNAPTDPAARYAWAATECMRLIAGCTARDVSDNYDRLIEQSCRAANVSMNFAAAAQVAERKNPETCRREITACMTERCGAEWTNCASNADMDRLFANCLISTDCGHDPNTAAIRTGMQSQRDNLDATRISRAEAMAAQRRQERESTAQQARNDCRSGRLKQACVTQMCANFANNCENDRDETAMATSLCRYVDIACGNIR